MTRRRVIPELCQQLPPHPLMPSGHRFAGSDRPAVTGWSEVLPPISFSRARLLELGAFATAPPLDISDDVITLGIYLAPKLKFLRPLGCWTLPLKAEHDLDPAGRKRARYPTVTVSALGYQGQLAHRATVETFAGAKLEGRSTHVDHRCRNHACCNPYHLEPVTASVNNFRGVDARHHATQRPLIELPPGSQLTYDQLATIISGVA